MRPWDAVSQAPRKPSDFGKIFLSIPLILIMVSWSVSQLISVEASGDTLDWSLKSKKPHSYQRFFLAARILPAAQVSHLRTFSLANIKNHKYIMMWDSVNVGLRESEPTFTLDDAEIRPEFFSYGSIYFIHILLTLVRTNRYPGDGLGSLPFFRLARTPRLRYYSSCSRNDDGPSWYKHDMILLNQHDDDTDPTSQKTGLSYSTSFRAKINGIEHKRRKCGFPPTSQKRISSIENAQIWMILCLVVRQLGNLRSRCKSPLGTTFVWLLWDL